MTGCCPKATPLCAAADGWIAIASCVADPAVIDTVEDVAAVNPAAVKVSVRDPAVPVIERFVHVATPLAFVVAVSVPPKVPPPVAIDAVTTTPAWLAALFDASCN